MLAYVWTHLLASELTSCWFHGSSFKGFSIVFPVFWLAKFESSQKSNRMWFFGDLLHHICSALTETIWVTNYATSFGAKKMFRKPSSKLLRWFLIRETNNESLCKSSEKLASRAEMTNNNEQRLPSLKDQLPEVYMTPQRQLDIYSENPRIRTYNFPCWSGLVLNWYSK